MAFDPLDHLHQRLVGMTLLVGDTGHANDGRLPDIVQIHFGYRDVEFAAQPAYHGFEYGALSFERIIARQVQFNCAEANDHITPRMLFDENHGAETRNASLKVGKADPSCSR